LSSNDVKTILDHIDNDIVKTEKTEQKIERQQYWKKK